MRFWVILLFLVLLLNASLALMNAARQTGKQSLAFVGFGLAVGTVAGLGLLLFGRLKNNKRSR